MEKECLNCKGLIIKPVNESKKNWINRHKFCSRKCADEYKKNKPMEWLEKYKFVKGEHSNKRTEFKSEDVSCDKNCNWKGDEVGYSGLHYWVANNFGKPMKCERCGSEECSRYEWHNIDGEYTRERDSWIRLCVKCHRLEHSIN